MRGRLVDLRPPEEADFELVSTWMRPGNTASLASGRSEFHSAEELRRRAESGADALLMVVTKSGETIGFVRWGAKMYHGSYDIGGLIADPEYWDSGCGAEASALVLQYLFHSCNAHRVQFVVGLYNRRTVTMLLNTGIVVEGVLRDYFFLDGEYHDALVASVLREEYYALDGWGDVEDTIPAAEKKAAVEEFQRVMRERWSGELFKRLVERS